MQFSQRLRRLRKERGLSQTQVAAHLTRLGYPITQRGLSKWERGDTQPNGEQFLQLCRLYRVRDVLRVFFDQAPEETGVETGLNDLGLARLREYARLLKGDEAFVRSGGVIRAIPLYDLPASAGTGQFLDGESHEMLEVDDTIPANATFAVRLAGDSMMPRFADGQIVYVHQQQTLEPGECGIFLLNGDAYCKIWGGPTKPILISLNKKYPPIPLSEYDALKVLGRVVK